MRVIVKSFKKRTGGGGGGCKAVGWSVDRSVCRANTTTNSEDRGWEEKKTINSSSSLRLNTFSWVNLLQLWYRQVVYNVVHSQRKREEELARTRRVGTRSAVRVCVCVYVYRSMLQTGQNNGNRASFSNNRIEPSSCRSSLTRSFAYLVLTFRLLFFSWQAFVETWRVSISRAMYTKVVRDRNSSSGRYQCCRYNGGWYKYIVDILIAASIYLVYVCQISSNLTS